MMAVVDATAAALGRELSELLRRARAERLSLSLYRFADKPQVALEAHPSSDFRAQHEGMLEDILLQMQETIRAASPQVDDSLDAPALGTALLRLLEATPSLTVFVNFLHPAGGESSCRVEVIRPEPLQVLTSRLAPDPLEAIEAALEALAV